MFPPGKDSGLEFADHFACGTSPQGSPNIDVDVFGDRSNRAIDQQRMHDSGVVAAGCDRRVRWVGRRISLFDGSEVHVVRGAGFDVSHLGVGSEGCGETVLMNSALDPFRMTVVRFKSARPTADRLGACGWCRGRIAPLLDDRLECLHFTEGQRLARPVCEIASSNTAVRPECSVAVLTRYRIEHHPRSEVRRVVDRILLDSIFDAGAVVDLAWAQIHWDANADYDELCVVRQRKVDQILKIGLIQIRKQSGLRSPLAVAGTGKSQAKSRGKHAVTIVVIVQCKPDLLEIVLALNATSRLARLLDGRQQQGDQHRDDRDDHQQFDQRKSDTARLGM